MQTERERDSIPVDEDWVSVEIDQCPSDMQSDPLDMFTFTSSVHMFDIDLNTTERWHLSNPLFDSLMHLLGLGLGLGQREENGDKLPRRKNTSPYTAV
jgi:hypothetical protein